MYMIIGQEHGLKTIIYEKHKHIGIIYQYFIESIKLMVQEHYDTPEYEGTLFFLNVFMPIESISKDILQNHTKKVFYFLEHRFNEGIYKPGFWIYEYSMKYNMPAIKQLGIDEIWTNDYKPQFAELCNDKLSIPYVYKPVRYTTFIKEVDDIYTTPKNIDCGFIGVISEVCPARTDFILDLERKHCFSLKLITQSKNLQSVISEMNTCKYILDLPRLYEHATQNQTRIFELLCMGYTVCAKKFKVNMFPGLIYEWNSIDELSDIVHRGEYISPTEAYKEMTYTDEAYEQYVNNLIKLQDGV